MLAIIGLLPSSFQAVMNATVILIIADAKEVN